MDLDDLSEQVVIPTGDRSYPFLLFRGYVNMLRMTLGIEVPARYVALSDWGNPELGLRIFHRGDADLACIGEGV